MANILGLIDPRRLVFIDQTWTKTNMTRLRGWHQAASGYFIGEEILACEAAAVTPLVPKPRPSCLVPAFAGADSV